MVTFPQRNKAADVIDIAARHEPVGCAPASRIRARALVQPLANFERGLVGIHSLSAAAIEDVAIGDGEDKPIRIEITMNNSSGIYQVDSLLKAKLEGSGLEPYVEVVAHIDTEAEKRLVPIYRLEI